MNAILNKKDEIIMSLVHYFVTEENYTPINVQGVQDEIWLENLNAPYKIIRINSKYIHNNDQYDMDIFKMKFVLKQIKRKTLSFKMNVLNICLDLGEYVNVKDKNEIEKNIATVSASSISDIKKNEYVRHNYPKIITSKFKKNIDIEEVIHVTDDINNKTNEENRKFEEVFKPKKIIITYILIIICIMMYFVSLLLPNNLFTETIPNFLNSMSSNNVLQSIFKYFSNNLTSAHNFIINNFITNKFNINLIFLGANNRELVLNGDLSRLITSAFLHGGLVHLIVNMYSLYIIGIQVENYIGKIKFLIIYLLSALMGSLFSIIFTNSYSVGASGAIFGLMGSLLYFGYHYRLYLSNALLKDLIPIIIVNLVIGFSLSGIDNYAHIGGLIGGYLSTMIVGLEYKSNKLERINGIIVYSLIVAFLIFALLKLI